MYVLRTTYVHIDLKKHFPTGYLTLFFSCIHPPICLRVLQKRWYCSFLEIFVGIRSLLCWTPKQLTRFKGEYETSWLFASLLRARAVYAWQMDKSLSVCPPHPWSQETMLTPACCSFAFRHLMLCLAYSLLALAGGPLLFKRTHAHTARPNSRS